MQIEKKLLQQLAHTTEKQGKEEEKMKNVTHAINSFSYLLYDDFLHNSVMNNVIFKLPIVQILELLKEYHHRQKMEVSSTLLGFKFLNIQLQQETRKCFQFLNLEK